jgi:hypothetical protein
MDSDCEVSSGMNVHQKSHTTWPKLDNRPLGGKQNILWLFFTEGHQYCEPMPLEDLFICLGGTENDKLVFIFGYFMEDPRFELLHGMHCDSFF